ncbi:MAG: selenoneine biosynthesis selenosugar synthase SenB [Burkholderiaceae bacterium]
MVPRRPRVCIVSPAQADANNGNWHTASRWQKFLAPVADVQIVLAWDGAPADALIALHARRSADSIERFHARHPHVPLALVMTGTDLYRDIRTDAGAQHALKCASHVVVLQDEGLQALPAEVRARARVIVQSATKLARRDRATVAFELIAVGHLREEKDPATLMAAARLLPADAPLQVTHIGGALDPVLGALARETSQACPRYRWLGALPRAAARRQIARAGALVHMSRIEGGANVVIEAVRSGVPVLASRIDGNVGLLGTDYGGYFPVGDAPALARLMQRAASDDSFLAHLRTQCALREPRFTPATERAAVRSLLADMLALQANPSADTIAKPQ